MILCILSNKDIEEGQWSSKSLTFGEVIRKRRMIAVVNIVILVSVGRVF